MTNTTEIAAIATPAEFTFTWNHAHTYAHDVALLDADDAERYAAFICNEYIPDRGDSDFSHAMVLPRWAEENGVAW